MWATVHGYTWKNQSPTMVAWGNITGTLANQADLVAALATKANDSTVVHKAGNETITGVKTFNDSTIVMQNVAGTFTVTLTNTVTANRVLTLPNVTDVLISRSSSDTVTNKTFSNNTKLAGSTQTTSTSVTTTSNPVQYVDATAWNITITLPTIANWQWYRIYKIDATANTVTVQRAWTDTINGGTNVVISKQYAWYECLWWWGTNWVAEYMQPTETAWWTPWGSSTQLQYNNAGVFWGITWATTNGTTVTLTSPIITTSITTGSATLSVFDATATTVTAFQAATTMTIGWTPTTAITHNYSTNATAAATTKTVNLGTWGAASSTTNINIWSANGGTTTINSLLISLWGITWATTTGTIELWNASDTTLSRSAAGRLAVEWVNVVTISSADTLTNKTMTASTNVIGWVTMTLGTDATWDIYYRSAGWVLTRLPIWSGTQVLWVSAGIPAWTTPSGWVWDHGCYLTQTTGTTGAFGAYTTLWFDTESYDTDGYHDNVTNNSRITIPASRWGTYIISGWAGQSVNFRALKLIKNWTTQLTVQGAVGSSWSPSGTDAGTFNLSWTGRLVVTDFVELQLYTTSNTVTSSTYTYFSAQQIA